MAIRGDDIIRDENERGNLQRAIADLETAIAASNPGTRRILEFSLEGIKARVVTLDKKISDAVREREVETQRQASAIAALAQKEANLSESEKATYSGFLAKEFFTKKDFGKLDEFYTHSYDRLSEGGKEEMSKRIHEGIKRGEFKAMDLPASVLKRDAELSRDHSAIRTTEPDGHTSRTNTQTHAQEGVSTAKSGDGVAVKSSQPSPNPQFDLSSIDLKGVKLVTTASTPTSASIPDASERGTNGRS